MKGNSEYIVSVFDAENNFRQSIIVEAPNKKAACMGAIHEVNECIKGDISMRARQVNLGAGVCVIEEDIISVLPGSEPHGKQFGDYRYKDYFISFNDNLYINTMSGETTSVKAGEWSAALQRIKKLAS